MDVHKASISIAMAEQGLAEPIFLSRIANDEAALDRWLRRQYQRWGSFADVLACYEAGPCGYGLYRYLRNRGLPCWVVAPGLVPQQPTRKRIKTDRRDAIKLAKALRGGELESIWVPDARHEALRRLVRNRYRCVHDRTRARQQLTKFLLLHSLSPPPKATPWTRRHARWLDTLPWPDANDEFVFGELRHHIRECCDRLDRYGEAMEAAVADSPLRPAIEALQCLKGFRLITATAVCTELGDIARFLRPDQLMSYAGLVPGVQASGERYQTLGITKAGNRHLRTPLVEAAWSYRHRPHVGVDLIKRQKGQPAEVVAISWKAQHRLNRQYRQLVGRGKHRNKAIVAVARELLGFVWQILRVVEPLAWSQAA
jgi:transposase